MGPPPSAGAIGRFSLFGIPVRLHFTFILLVAFLVMLGADEGQSFVGNTVYIVALFASVFLHEVAHALVARRYGIRTVEILLLPLGGVSRLERQPQRKEEFWIALAGPLANLLIGGIILAGLRIASVPFNWESMQKATDATLLPRIAAANFLLGLFNLLPAFPMDGGRILRAALAARRSEPDATRIAARVGSALAVLMALYGLLSKDFFLLFIAFFLYLGAMQEGMASTGRSLMRGARVRDAMITDLRTLHHGDTMRDAAQLLLSTSQQDFPVLTGERVTGLLTRAALLRSMASEGPDAYVAGAMDRNFISLSAEMDLTDAAPLLGPGGACALVMEEDRLLGMLTTENLSEFLILRQIGQARAND
jgi:Zn-dependent protease/CBS domain-containing protein